MREHLRDDVTNEDADDNLLYLLPVTPETPAADDYDVTKRRRGGGRRRKTTTTPATATTVTSQADDDDVMPSDSETDYDDGIFDDIQLITLLSLYLIFFVFPENLNKLSSN